MTILGWRCSLTARDATALVCAGREDGVVGKVHRRHGHRLAQDLISQGRAQARRGGKAYGRLLEEITSADPISW